MLCPICKTKTIRKDSRPTKLNMIRRRHECRNGHRFNTLEMPVKFYAEVTGIDMGKLADIDTGETTGDIIEA